MSKKTVAVLFGGQSSEHEISCRSAINIIHNIDREAYDLVLVGITKEGHWVKVNRIEDIEDGSWRESKIGAVLSPDATEQCLMIHEQAAITRVKIDLVFPILHGLYGEDGTIQGLCKLAKIPFVGCGVTASAVGMDKGITKLVVHSLGITQADFLLVTREMLKDMCAVIERTESLFSYPVFVKPCNAGSSCGVTKVHGREELSEAFREAARFDSRILVEECIVGREIECAVLGGNRHHHRILADLQAAHPVPRDDAMHPGTILKLRDDVAQYLRRGRMRRILDRVHALSPVVVAHDANERRHGTTRISACAIDQRARVEGVVSNTCCNLC